MPIIAWLAERLTGKIAVPLLGVLLLTNLVAGVGLGITRHTLSLRTKDLATEKRVHLADIEIWKAGAVMALVRDRQHALNVQVKQDEITKEQDHDLQGALARAHADASRIVRDYAQAHYNGGKGSNLPQAADTPGRPVETPAGAFLSAADVDACAVAHTIAQGWQDWWNREYPVMLEGSRSEPGGQGSASGAVDVDRDPVTAVRGRAPLAQSDGGIAGQAGMPVDLLAALDPGSIAALPAPIETGSADPEQHKDAGAGRNDDPPDHKNFLP
jgi:hypothetical protein